MKKLFDLFLCLLSLFCVYSSAMAASVPSTDSVPVQNILKQEKASANEHLKSGNHEKAFEYYSRLLREDPLDDEINLGYARAATQTQNYGQAVLAYERLLSKYPNEPTLLKELAYVLSIQNDSQRAELELAKDGTASKEESAKLAEKWSDEHDRTQITGKLSAGMIYDSNVNNGPASNDVSLGNWNFSLINNKAKETLAGFVGAQVDAGYRLDIVSPWWVVGSANVFARYNANQDLYDMKLASSEFVAASAGIRYLGSKVLVDIRAKAQIIDYAFLQNVYAIGPEANIIYAVNPKVHLITRANIDNRVYSGNDPYNGWYGSAGQYVRLFMGEGGHNVTIGGRYLGGTAREMALSYDGFEANLDFMFVLPWHDIHIAPFIAYGGEYFYGTATIFEEEYRNDHRIRTGVNVSIPLNESWKIEVGYQFMNNISNSELYTYSQHIVNTGITWSF